MRPGEMTDVQLRAHVLGLIESGRAELERYTTPIDEDFLTTGVVRFNQVLNMLGVSSFRFMNMAMEARHLAVPINAMARGKKRLLDTKVMELIASRPDATKRMDATERKLWAINQLSVQQQDVDSWEDMGKDLGLYIKDLEDVQRSTREAAQRLQASLWSVKVHGTLGELQRNAPYAPDSGSVMAQSTYRGYQGGGINLGNPANTVGEAPNQEIPIANDPEIDKLLGNPHGEDQNG